MRLRVLLMREHDVFDAGDEHVFCRNRAWQRCGGVGLQQAFGGAEIVQRGTGYVAGMWGLFGALASP